ncbi:MAG: ATP-binding protein [Candidatus Methanoperedens sp.]|nr:ATP-binding protein [Candidatus Methanoperedens sp.]
MKKDTVASKESTDLRARAEEKIREQAALLNNAHDAIIVRDMEDGIIYWNKGAAYLYGWTAEEAIGKNAVELLYQEISPALTDAQKSVLERDEWSGELHQVAKGGKELIVESHWTLMRSRKGRPKSILTINTDITGRQMLEAQFLRAQRTESIGRLAGGIAHDLNNMMTPIMLSLQMLREKLTDDKSRRLIDVLEKNAQRSTDLIKQVMSFSRGVEGERETLLIGDLITEIENIVKETFPRSIEIITHIPADLWSVAGDATQLHQVLMNLCVNARDAMPEGGILSISAGNAFVDEEFSYTNIDARVGPYTVITVSDTGTGIPPGILDKIFEPFFTTKEVGKGTGLGLSTSITIVKSHGGFIDVHSKAGVGTTFNIYLPAIKAGTQKEEPEPRIRSEEHSGKGEAILVIDDEAPILETTRTTLQTNGYRVITASNGVEAVSLYAQNRDEVKAVLLDMMMPFMDGPACIRALRQINPGIKIIAVSGQSEKDRFSKIPERVNVFLSKPYTAETLLKTIHEIQASA